MLLEAFLSTKTASKRTEFEDSFTWHSLFCFAPATQSEQVGVLTSGGGDWISRCAVLSLWFSCASIGDWRRASIWRNPEEAIGQMVLASTRVTVHIIGFQIPHYQQTISLSTISQFTDNLAVMKWWPNTESNHVANHDAYSWKGRHNIEINEHTFSAITAFQLAHLSPPSSLVSFLTAVGDMRKNSGLCCKTWSQRDTVLSTVR